MACLLHQQAALALSLGCLSVRVAAGGTVETLDHRVLEGAVRFSDDGGLVVQAPDGPQRLTLDQVRLARFDAPRQLESTLPKGWQVEDIGQVRGSSTAKDDVFSLRASGGSVKDSKQQMAHFAHRIVRAEGEIAGRLEGGTFAGPALAGFMLRENLDPIGGMAFLAVAADRHLRLESREAGWGPIKRSDLGPVTLPIWLKLARLTKENSVSAFRSTDGVNWQKLAQTRLNCPGEPFPAGEDRWRPRLLAGLAVSGTSNDTPATARFDHVSVSVRGLLGEYYEDEDFRRLRFARPDSRVDFYWGLGSPAPDLDRDHFSVRWTGQVEAKYSENHRFVFEADDSARLWVNGEEIPKTAWRQRLINPPPRRDSPPPPPPPRELPLTAGQKCTIKLEYREGEGPASVKLGWSSKSQAVEVISSSALSYTYSAASPDEEGDGTTTNALPARGVLLRGGSFLAGDVQSADDTVTAVAFAGRKDFPILNTKIASVIFRPSRRAPALDQPGRHAGLFLRNGDFFEGDFQSVTGRTLIVSSVLLGRKKFNLDHAGVVALVLNSVAPQTAAFEVKLLDGTLLRATRLRLTRDAAVVTDITLGDVTIPQGDLAELRRTASASGEAQR